MSLRKSENEIIKELIFHFGRFPYTDGITYGGYDYDDTLSLPEFRPLGEYRYKIFLNSSPKDDLQGSFQLAHEMIHHIAPIPKENVLCFEEGLATWYQLDFIRRHYKKSRDGKGRNYYKGCMIDMSSSGPNYYSAYQDILKIIKGTGAPIWQLASEIINSQGSLSNINSQQLTEFTLIDDIELHNRLCQKFYP